MKNRWENSLFDNMWLAKGRHFSSRRGSTVCKYFYTTEITENINTNLAINLKEK